MLTLNLFGVKLPNLGAAFYSIDSREPIAIINWKDNFNKCNDLDRCCLEAKKLVTCFFDPQKLSLGEVDWVCQSGEGDVMKIWFNNKAYYYCSQQNFW